MNKITLGCCVYTVRDEFAKDPYATLYALADMGYTATEIGDFTTLGSRELKNALRKAGLSLSCIHFAIEYQEAWTRHILEFADMLGSRYIGYPALRAGKADSAEGYKEEAEVMNKLGKIYKANGFMMLYHNHDFEFKRFGGQYGLDILREYTDPELVSFELDTYWIARGGECPQEYMKKFAGRVPVVHCKDKAEDDFFAPVGEGTLDFPAIVAAAREIGATTFLVEQDAWRRPSLECARSSYEYLSTLL